MFRCAQFNIAYSNQLKVISGIIIKHSNTQSVRFIVNKDQSSVNKSNNSQDELSTDSSKTVNTEIPEPPTNCCMSGCANCVWIEYAEKLTEIFKDGGEKARKEIMEKVTDPNIRAFLMMELRNLNLKK